MIMTEFIPRLNNPKENTFIDHTILRFISLILTLQRMAVVFYYFDINLAKTEINLIF
jgi:uncharacterized protein YybS (DUF2232 family)